MQILSVSYYILNGILNFAHSYHTFSDSCCRRYSGHRRRRDKTLAIASYSFLVPLYETVVFKCIFLQKDLEDRNILCTFACY